MQIEPKSRYVAYYRVSTSKQATNGHGLAAQRNAVLNHVKDGKLISEFTETFSGRKNDRPQLAQALAACRLHKATLVIAKLDRLARNTALIANLLESGVEFQAVDMPFANRL